MTAGEPARRPLGEDSGGADRSGTAGAGEPAGNDTEARVPTSDAAPGAGPETSNPAGGAPVGAAAGADVAPSAEFVATGTGADGTDSAVTAAAEAPTNDAGAVAATEPGARATGSGAAGVDSGVAEPGSVAGSAAGAHSLTADTSGVASAAAAQDSAEAATGSAGESVAARSRPIDWGDEEIAPAAGAGTGRGGRQPVTALALLALGAAALWGSSRLTWVTVTSADGLTEPRTDDLNGGVWFGALTPLALVLLAAIAAVLATRGWMRRLVGVVVALIAAVTAVPALALLTGAGATEQRAAELAGLPGRAQVQELVTSSGPAALTLCGALAAFGAGLLLARMPAGTEQLSGKYDNPATRKAAATQAVQQRGSGDVLPERVLWDALDAGADPTDADDPTGATDSTGGSDPTGADKPSTRTGPANETARSTSAGSADPVDRDAAARDEGRSATPRSGDTP
ncbi:TIGR02234 family membrane protein [Nocardia flavorosea]|uniref:TIGR02234 family membrane protein n=1 Tax=Nocardia flavorosea TaxID=53429 RepID=UPI0007C7F637|nr:TIGR02234 family membrane protein [Nocardia flavorosea]